MTLDGGKTLEVQAANSGMLSVRGADVGATFWAQDINAIAALLPADPENVRDGTQWTSTPPVDFTGTGRPDIQRQIGSLPMLVPLQSQINISPTQIVIQGRGRLTAGGDRNQRTTDFVAVAIFRPDGTLLHAEGVVNFGALDPNGLGATAFYYTRSWSVDLIQ